MGLCFPNAENVIAKQTEAALKATLKSNFIEITL